MGIALTYKEMKDFQKAITFIEKCLSIFKDALPQDHPYQKKAMNRMAGIYYASKNYPKAIEIYQKLVEVFPKVKKQHFYNEIGLAYAKNKQFQEAHNAFSEYEKLFPGTSETYRNRAVYYALQDENEKALMFLRRAVELRYNDVQWLKTDNSMDNLRNDKAFIELVEKLETLQDKRKP